MVRALPILMAGMCIGAGVAWSMLAVPSATPPVATPQAQQLVCDQSDLKRMRERVTQLESELAAAKSGQSVAVPPQESAAAQPEAEEALTWKISAIEKFVPLSDGQKDRLREKYKKERAGDGDTAESLDDILGPESAAFYQERVQAAFKKVQDEEVAREVVWLSRTLSLSEDQEGSVRAILANVEAEVTKGRTHGQSGNSPQERVREMIAQNRRRSELRTQQLKKVLTPEQFQAYLRAEAESSASDVEIFHDPGAAAAPPSE